MTSRRTADQIVDAVAAAARSLFVDRSPSAVSMRDIAATAGVNLGLIHRYVGSKDDVIALVLERHTEAARRAAATPDAGEMIARVATSVVTDPSTGRLLAGMILDGLPVADLKGDFPLLDRLAEHDDPLPAALVYALALGWEVFGPSLLGAVDAEPDPEAMSAALGRAMTAIADSGR